MPVVKYKRLSGNAKEPSFGSEQALGADLVATSRSKIKDGYIEYGTGLAVEMSKGYGGYIFPRSSISKMDMSLANCVGVIDPDYRGELKIRMRVLNMIEDGNMRRIRNPQKIYKVGDKIAQFTVFARPVIEFKETDNLNDTSRGKGSFGSTGE